MSTIVKLLKIANQERQSAEDYMTRAQAEPGRAREFHACAALCNAQADMAEMDAKVQQGTLGGNYV